MYEDDAPGTEDERRLPPPDKGSGVGFLGWIKRLALLVVILGLAGSTLYLLAERNRRLYFLSTEKNHLVVSRGSWVPTWKTPYLPKDPTFAKAYAPVELPPGAAPVPEQRFDERQDLDQALFDVLMGWAEPRIHADEADALAQGAALVDRAALLPGVSAEQSARLYALRAEVFFSEGRARAQKALGLLQEASERLEQATEISFDGKREAARLHGSVGASARILGEALDQLRKAAGRVAPAAGQEADHAASPGAQPTFRQAPAEREAPRSWWREPPASSRGAGGAAQPPDAPSGGGMTPAPNAPAQKAPAGAADLPPASGDAGPGDDDADPAAPVDAGDGGAGQPEVEPDAPPTGGSSAPATGAPAGDGQP